MIFKKTKQNKKKRWSSEEDFQVTETTTQCANIQPPRLCQVEQPLGKLFPPRTGCQPLTHLLNQATREKLPSALPYSLSPFHSKPDQSSKSESPSSFLLGCSPCSTAHKSSGHLSSVFEKDTEAKMQLNFTVQLQCSPCILHSIYSLFHIFITLGNKLCNKINALCLTVILI